MLRILIVEENQFNAELARDLLLSDGAEVEVVCTAEAMRHIVAAGSRPDVVLLNIHPVDGQGVDLIREWSDQLDVPVVAVTSEAKADSIRLLLAAGFAAVITKPIDTRSFCATIRGFARPLKVTGSR